MLCHATLLLHIGVESGHSRPDEEIMSQLAHVPVNMLQRLSCDLVLFDSKGNPQGHVSSGKQQSSRRNVVHLCSVILMRSVGVRAWFRGFVPSCVCLYVYMRRKGSKFSYYLAGWEIGGCPDLM